MTSTPIGISRDPRYQIPDWCSLIEWNPNTGQPIRFIPELGKAQENLEKKVRPSNTFTVSADGSIIAGIVGSDVLVIDARALTVLAHLMTPPTPTHPDFALSVTVTSDAQYIAVGTGFGYVHIYSSRDGANLRTINVFPGGTGFRCNAIAFSPDGQYLATGRGGMSVGDIDDGWVRIWRVSDGTLLSRLEGGAGAVRALCWAPQGRFVVAGDDKLIRLWRTNELPKQPEQVWSHNNTSYSAKFSIDGALAASDGSEIVIYQ